MLLAACTKPSLAPAPAPEQYDRYIFFSHSVETKATLVENAGDIGTFGVVGFKYDFYAKDEDGNYVKDADGNLVENTWDEYKNTTPDPNVFYDEVINSEGTSTYDITPVETVWVTAGADGTTADYSPLQGWSNNKKYAFFAFYPHDLELVNLDGDTPYSGGVPAVKYSMNPADLKASMVDVMTAGHYEDRYWKSSGDNNIENDEINFSFSHRLSCLGLDISNLGKGTINLNAIKLTLSDLRYHQMIILLDGTGVTKTEAASGNAVLSLDLTGEETLTADKTQELTDKLIFIPQETALSFELEIDYTRVATGYNDSRDSFKTSLSTQLEEGKKYLINIKFTDSTVEVKENMDAGAWTDIPPVNSSFK